MSRGACPCCKWAVCSAEPDYVTSVCSGQASNTNGFARLIHFAKRFSQDIGRIFLYNDVTTLKGSELPPVDVLCGGFPCQDVSLGGLRAGIKQGTRSGLWLEYARLIGEIRPRYAIIENVRGLLSLGIESVLNDMAEIGYDAEWEVLPAAALGAPHHRERVFIVAYPHRQGLHGKRILSPLERNVGELFQSCNVSDWLGIRFDRSRKESAVQAYGKPVLHRVDDGSTGRMDYPINIPPIPKRVLPGWINRLKALGNGIVPHQAYTIGSCILEYEGIAVPSIPLDF